jgi:hypothetical protein
MKEPRAWTPYMASTVGGSVAAARDGRQILLDWCCRREGARQLTLGTVPGLSRYWGETSRRVIRPRGGAVLLPRQGRLDPRGGAARPNG